MKIYLHIITTVEAGHTKRTNQLIVTELDGRILKMGTLIMDLIGSEANKEKFPLIQEFHTNFCSPNPDLDHLQRFGSDGGALVSIHSKIAPNGAQRQMGHLKKIFLSTTRWRYALGI